MLLGYASCVWAYSMIQVITHAFYAKNDTVTPVKIAVSVVGLNLILNLVLMDTVEGGGARLVHSHLRNRSGDVSSVASSPSCRFANRNATLPDGQNMHALHHHDHLSAVIAMSLPSGNSWLQQVQSTRFWWQ